MIKVPKGMVIGEVLREFDLGVYKEADTCVVEYRDKELGICVYREFVVYFGIPMGGCFREVCFRRCIW